MKRNKLHRIIDHTKWYQLNPYVLLAPRRSTKSDRRRQRAFEQNYGFVCNDTPLVLNDDWAKNLWRKEIV